MKNNIRKFRKERGWTLERLGKEVSAYCNITPPREKAAVQKWEMSGKDVKMQYLRAMEKLFNRSIPEILNEQQPEVDNISGKIYANALIKLFDEAVGGVNVQNENAIKTLQVDDDSNEPALYKNWLVRYQDRQEGIDPEAIDLPAVVKLKDGTMLIRKLQKGSQPDRWHLTTLAGGKLMADAEVEWAAAVHYVLPRRA